MTTLLSTTTEPERRILRRIVEGDHRFVHSDDDGDYLIARELQRRRLLRVTCAEVALTGTPEKGVLTAVTFDLAECDHEALDDER